MRNFTALSIAAALLLPMICGAQKTGMVAPPCISATLDSNDILNCPYDQYDHICHSNIQTALSEGKKNLSTSNYVGALYFFKNGLNEVEPCGSARFVLDDTGQHEVLAKDAERRGDYKFAATQYGSILESRLDMYEHKIKINKASCIGAIKSDGSYSNTTASTILKLKISENKISAIAKISNYNDTPIFIINEKSKKNTPSIGNRYSEMLSPTFAIFRQYEAVKYLGPKMLGKVYKLEDFYEIAPHSAITFDYKDIETQYDFFYRADTYSIVHRHLEYDPAAGSLTMVSSNPVQFSYDAQ